MDTERALAAMQSCYLETLATWSLSSQFPVTHVPKAINKPCCLVAWIALRPSLLDSSEACREWHVTAVLLDALPPTCGVELG